ncbi:MAG: TetR/AcrR family transcriptional regulator [Hyphomicrobiaceae bacterium]|nr:TetR/AcrR family transcriptional regulator [Hyphomicrobiaceae bacterium]
MSRRLYRSPARKAAADETRARIVAAASALLGTTRDRRSFSLQAVAKQAGVTRLTVYKQFGSRRALLEAVFDELATRRGFRDLAKVMEDPDPHRALWRIVSFFCDFWSSGTRALLRLHSAGASDPDLDESVRERNERRRRMLSVLVRRMAKGRRRDCKPPRDLVDVLFALTSLFFFAQLQTGTRSSKAACRLVQAACEDAVRRAGLGPD